MSNYNTTREKLMTLVKTFHDTNYATMEVNYPGRMITDVEQAQDPFVTMEISMTSENMCLPSRNTVRIEGQLVLNHLAREGNGSKIFNDYTDLLMDYLGLRTLDSINFYEVQPYNNKNIRGFDGVMNSVMFDIDYFNI